MCCPLPLVLRAEFFSACKRTSPFKRANAACNVVPCIPHADGTTAAALLILAAPAWFLAHHVCCCRTACAPGTQQCSLQYAEQWYPLQAAIKEHLADLAKPLREYYTYENLGDRLSNDVLNKLTVSGGCIVAVVPSVSCGPVPVPVPAEGSTVPPWQASLHSTYSMLPNGA